VCVQQLYGPTGFGAVSRPVASFWPHDTEQDRQTTQNNERHPRRPDTMRPGGKEA